MENKVLTGREEADLKIKEKVNESLRKIYGLGYNGEAHNKPMTDFLKYKMNEMSIRSVYKYSLEFIRFREAVGRPAVEYLTEKIMSDYFTTLKNKGSKPATLRVTYFAFNQLFKWCVDEGIMKENPMKRMKAPKMPKKDDFRDDILTKEELEIFMNNARSEKNKNHRILNLAILTVFLNTGMRCSSLVELNTNDINIPERKIRIYTKGDKIKEFQLSESAFKFVQDWINLRNSFELDKNNTAFFLNCSSHNRILKKTIEYFIKKYAKGINKNVSPHKLRATFATLCFDAGMDIVDVKNLMGHSSIEMTETYIRGRKNKTQEASNIITGIINGTEVSLTNEKKETVEIITRTSRLIQEGNYWRDNNGNSWSIDKYTKEQAEEMYASLTNCHNCIDCERCNNCENCVNCNDCINCTKCVFCNNCINCINCAKCDNEYNKTE